MMAIETLEHRLDINRQDLNHTNESIGIHTELTEKLRQIKHELEASIKDIEVALSVLRKM